ncbi:MAG: metallophosphoesterase [Gemmatimonadaceae bacterium]
MKRFGRARDLSRLRRVAWVALDFGYRGGWAAALARRFRLHGRIAVLNHDIRIERWARGRPLRLVFASDFHAGPVTHPELLNEASRAIAGGKPDLLLLGGDFISPHARYIDGLADRLRQIDAPLGKFAVLGNHDLYADDEHIVARLAGAGVRTLNNESVRLPAPFDEIYVCGLDDPTVGSPDAQAALRGADGVRIVLMHSPEGLLSLRDYRFDVAFCGHTHGGQVALPGGRPLWMPGGPLNRMYAHGTHALPDHGHATLIVSRGIGCSGVPVRLFARPEVHLCTLLPAVVAREVPGAAGHADDRMRATVAIRPVGDAA